jgi:predicted permease
VNPLWHALRAEEFKTFQHPGRWQKSFLDDSRLQVLDSARGFSPLRDQIGVPLMVLMGMVGLLALMTCVNLSSLLLVRAAGRVREMSVRYAMGAGRWQVSRQLLTEGLLLGMAGGGLGLVLAPVIARVLIRQLADNPNGEAPFSANPDMRVLLFTFVLAIVVSVAFSLAPALRFMRPDLVNSLKQQSATGTGGQLRFRRLSVAVQIGLSLLLLVGAGLFVRTLRNLRSVDVGFATDHLLAFRVNPRLAGYQPEQAQALNRRILQALAALPGVRAVAATDDPDLAHDSETGGVSVAGYNAGENEDLQSEEPWVTPQYFSAMQVPVLAGRTFTDGDIVGKANVTIVNSSFAHHFFGGPQNALGHVLQFGATGDHSSEAEIVGVVGDTKHSAVRDPIRRTAYRPLFQAAQPNSVSFLVRTWQSPQMTESAIRGAMQQVDSKLALGSLHTMEEQIDDNLANERMIALLSACFGILAMLLAGLGLYGVLAYSTAQRTREIGIRMALGAQRSGVVKLVLRDVLWMAGISIAVTIPICLFLSRLLRSQLYGVSSNDPITILLGIVLIAAVVLGAALLPARRAASTNPMQALRSE